jgi:hypothetical protein
LIQAVKGGHAWLTKSTLSTGIRNTVASHSSINLELITNSSTWGTVPSILHNTTYISCFLSPISPEAVWFIK